MLCFRVICRVETKETLIKQAKIESIGMKNTFISKKNHHEIEQMTKLTMYNESLLSFKMVKLKLSS